MANGNYLRSLRQLLLLTVLLIVAGGSYLTKARSTSWEEPLWVTVYPIAADGRQLTRGYIDRLTAKNFSAIEAFMARETDRYRVDIDRPIRIDVGEPVTTQPPAPPESGNPVSVALWSLKLRWWAYQSTKNQPGATPSIRLFLIYHDPAVRSKVPHSLGMQEGMIGVVHVFADRKMQSRNNVVIAHEMLHTLGATDKYALHNNLPIFPAGYAEPEKENRFPQKYAEIMGGRIPLSETDAVMPESLQLVRIGRYTALELRWTESI